MKEIRLSEREDRCLKAIWGILGQSDEGQATYFRFIARDSGIENVRRYVRSLARKGLVEYTRGLFDDDGMAAGSGYGLTEVGRDFCSKKYDEPN